MSKYPKRGADCEFADHAARRCLALISGVALMAAAVPAAAAWRGYPAAGGEWLVLPLVLVLRQLWKEAKRGARQGLFGEEESG
jgi:hypothetical protein